MNHEIYANLGSTDDFSIFEFLSVGPKGVIVKRIEFRETEYPEIYNLAFGDVDINGEIDDYAISNNKDRNKVLATVAYVIDAYLDKYPDRKIFFTGSTEERTRLYRIAIRLNYEELLLKFDIFCQTESGLSVFEENMTASGFLLRRKV